METDQNIDLSKENFEKWSQKISNSSDTIIEMTDISKTEENKELLEQITKLQETEENEDNKDTTKEIEKTFLLSNETMKDYLIEKNRNIQDKQTIYEYYYESLNEMYAKISITLIIFSSVITLFGSIQIGDEYMTNGVKLTFKILVIVFSFIITILSSVLKFKLYKEKIESIGKYMEQLELLIDDIEIFIKKIEIGQICDQDFYQQLNTISTIVTRTNTKLFNIRSDHYYQFYRKLKLIASKKWNIQHEIKTTNEKKYNLFLKQRLITMKERLDLKKEFTTIENSVDDISSFYNNDIFSLQKSNDNKEE